MVRGALRRINTYLSRRYREAEAPLEKTEPPARFEKATSLLRRLHVEKGEPRAYFEKHLPRLARTLTLVPESRQHGAILELGCYGQITPFLQEFCGYQSVRGAHYGPLGITEDKVVKLSSATVAFKVDLFDAERDRFPYSDATFETVLVCEMIEHLLRDPIQMLLECRRVLVEGGRLLLSTPNIASLTSVARVLHGYDNPQIYSHYDLPNPKNNEVPHVREYTAFELKEAVEAAGFEIELLITEPIAEWSKNLPYLKFLEDQGFNTKLRGEQIYCVAIKRAALPVTRFPKFLYF